jgi:hypothetical protein
MSANFLGQLRACRAGEHRWCFGVVARHRSSLIAACLHGRGWPIAARARLSGGEGGTAQLPEAQQRPLAAGRTPPPQWAPAPLSCGHIPWPRPPRRSAGCQQLGARPLGPGPGAEPLEGLAGGEQGAAAERGGQGPRRARQLHPAVELGQQRLGRRRPAAARRRFDQVSRGQQQDRGRAARGRQRRQPVQRARPGDQGSGRAGRAPT